MAGLGFAAPNLGSGNASNRAFKVRVYIEAEKELQEPDILSRKLHHPIACEGAAAMGIERCEDPIQVCRARVPGSST
jgi:hypothetical protein